MTAPRSGCVPPIMTHQAFRKSAVAAGTASCSTYAVHDSEATSPSVPARERSASRATVTIARSSSPISSNGTGSTSRSSPPVRHRTRVGPP